MSILNLVRIVAIRITSLQRNPVYSTSYVSDVNLEFWREETYVQPSKSCIFKGVTHPPGSLVQISECLSCICDHQTGKVTYSGSNSNRLAYSRA